MINKWLITPFLLCGELLLAETATAPKPTVAQKPKATAIQGIFLSGERNDVIRDGRPGMTGIKVMDFHIPGGQQPLIDLLQPYLGKPLTKKTVIEIKQKIMNHYVKQGTAMIGVEVPAQKTTGGVVQILVIKKTFGKAIYKGKAIYSQEKLESILGISPGEEISEYDLKNNVSWINRNNFQSVQMRFIRGNALDVVDIEFNSKRRWMFRPYVSGSNTGSATTGYGRMSAGVNWGNAFFIGDLLSVEYKTSNEFKRLHNYNITYTSFLPEKDIFTVFATYAKVKPFSRTSRIVAKSWQVRPRYTILFLPLYKPFQQTLGFEFDVKFSNSNVINLAGVPTVQQVGPPVIRNIYVTQFVLNYVAFNKIGKHSLAFNFAITGSPFTFLPYQSQFNFNRNRTNSRPRYGYLSFTFGDVITFENKNILSILLRTQLAPHTLPSTELFSVGGYSTVRGYHEAEASGDNGFIANFELRTRDFKTFPKSKGRITALAFVDYGVSNNLFIRQSTRPGAKRIPHTEHLIGVGPGIRYYVGSYFQLRCDYGIKLHKLFSNSPSARKLHAGFGELHIGALAAY